MLKGDWRKYATLGIATILACSWFSSVQSKPKHEQPRGQCEAARKECFQPTIITQHISSGDQSDPGEQPKTGKDSHFDLDRRAVEAAEDAARWTQYTFIVGIAGTIAVALALAASIWQNLLSRRAYLSAHRPKLRLRWIRTKTLEAGRPIMCSASFVNIGDTNAIIKRIGADCTYMGPADVFGTPLSDNKEDANIVVKPGVQADMKLECQLTLSEEQIDAVLRKEGTLIVNCVILYDDGNGVRRSTSVYRRLNPKIMLYEKLPDGFPNAEADFEN